MFWRKFTISLKNWTKRCMQSESGGCKSCPTSCQTLKRAPRVTSWSHIVCSAPSRTCCFCGHCCVSFFSIKYVFTVMLTTVCVCSIHSRIGSSSSTEPLMASLGSLDRNSFRHHSSFFSQLSGQTFYNNEYGHLSEEGFCDFFASPDAPCLASSNV